MKVKPCLHRVAYYETDQMGIVHHSNYIRWFEEARDEVVRACGIDYRQIEARGVLMPVVNVVCDYKSAAKYGDQVSIYALPRYFNGIRLRYEYEVRGEDGSLIVTGKSEHCFIDALTRKPVNLKKRMTQYCETLSRLVESINGGQE
ncbi:MAG: acyl-CoA thioesterase [Oscillospiraceae bacterium]|nr:acyl-CoA thioesterase [Oscillospiraceae bacterium]